MIKIDIRKPLYNNSLVHIPIAAINLDNPTYILMQLMQYQNTSFDFIEPTLKVEDYYVKLSFIRDTNEYLYLYPDNKILFQIDSKIVQTTITPHQLVLEGI